MRICYFLILFFTILGTKNTLAQSEETPMGLLTLGGSYLGIKKDQVKNKSWGGEASYSHAISATSSFGANILYNAGQDEYSSVNTAIFSIQPEFRNYFGKSVFRGVYLAINAEYEKITSTYGNSIAVGKNFGIGAGLGINPQLSKNISGNIKGALGYIINNNGSLRWNIGAGVAIKI